MLGMPKANGNLLKSKTDFLMDETLEFENGCFIKGHGSVSFMNFFDKIELYLENSVFIDDHYLNNGKFELARKTPSINLWDPFILNYKVKTAKSPISVSICENNMIRIKFNNCSLKIDALKLHIYTNCQGLKPIVEIEPRNLSHKISSNCIDQFIWQIESPRKGSEYALSFSKCPSDFKVSRIETAYSCDGLASGLIVKLAELDIDSTKVFNNPIVFKTKINENYYN